MSNSEAPRRSWKTFLLRALVFLPLLVLGDRGLFIAFRAVEPAGFDRASLEDKLKAVPDKSAYEVLLLGTSRTFNSILPKVVNPVIGSKVFKEAYVGKGPKYNLHFYRMYREIMGVPKVVVYGIDYFLFNIESQDRLMRRFPEFRDASAPALPGVSLLLANKNRIDQFLNAALDRLQDGLEPDRASNPDKNVADMESYVGGRAYDPSHVVTEIPPDFKKKRVPFSAPPGKEGDDYFELLRELKEDGVTILLVTIPDHIGTFRTYLNYRRFLRVHQRALKRLSYRGRSFLIDYDSPDRFPMDDRDSFINGGYGVANSHLSIKGANVFSEMVARDLKKILDEARSR